MGEERVSEIGHRIREARQRRGLSLADLAEQTGVDKSTLSRMEAGQRRVTATALADLADVLGVSMRDLVRPRQPRPHYAVAARLRETSTNETIGAALHRAHTLLELEGLVDELEVPVDARRAPLQIDLPIESSPIRAGEALASRARDALQLDAHPVVDLEQLAEQHLGVDVALHPLGDDQGVSGLAVSAPQTDNSRSVRFALVNSSPTLGHQRFTLVHELGHLLFGDAEEPLVDAGL